MFNIHQSVHHSPNGEIDERKAAKYRQQLMQVFAISPEAQPIREKYDTLGWADMMMLYSIDYLGSTPPEMSVSDFREVVFDLFPRKVSTEASSAEEIIESLQAFWQFLKREYHLKNADAMLAELEDDAVEDLRENLGDPGNFGPAKSFFMTGQEMGFDMTTQEGMDAFLLYYNSQLATKLGPGLPPDLDMLPGPADEFDDLLDIDDFEEDDDGISLPPLLTPKQRAEIRKKRKDQRQARKKNRKKK